MKAFPRDTAGCPEHLGFWLKTNLIKHVGKNTARSSHDGQRALSKKDRKRKASKRELKKKKKERKETRTT